MSTSTAALDSISRALVEIAGADEDQYTWDPARKFAGFARRLQLLAAQISRAAEGDVAGKLAAMTALRGVAAELEAARAPLADCRTKSRLYILVHCHELCDALREHAAAIAGWLALLDAPLSLIPDLRKRAADLCIDMRHSDLKTTENEERLYHTLQKEAAEVRRQSSKAVQSAIIMDVARALGIDPTDHLKLSDQIKHLRRDLSLIPASPSDRRILLSLEKIFDSWSSEPYITLCSADTDFEENAHIAPYGNFLCPLTKEVMKDPVVLESFHTYERTAIKYWFDRCLEDGRDPTCPVTGQVLKALELKPNIGLAGAIDEWVNRNVEVQIKSALQCFENWDSCSMEAVERMTDNVYRMSEEYPSSRYKVRNAGIVGHMVRLLNEKSKSMETQLRSKILIALHSMAKDDESMRIMLEGGMCKSSRRCLIGDSEKEKEYALRLLLEFSHVEGCCVTIAKEKGALVLLSTMAGDSNHPVLSNLAEEILKNIESEEANFHLLAEAGRLQPLLTRLCEGTEGIQIKIASILGEMALTNTHKGSIARKAGKVLVQMLSSPDGRQPSLRALHNLSTLDDNATILVDLGVLPPLTTILFTSQPDISSDLKDLAASTVANIVSRSGHWELSAADKEGHPMQSEFVIHRLLQLLSNSSSKCATSILQILYGIAYSAQASDQAAAHIKSGRGIMVILPFLEHTENDNRDCSFSLMSLLSEKLAEVLLDELRASSKLILLTEKLFDTKCSSNEKSDAAYILGNLPLSDEEVKTLGISVLKWSVSSLREQQQSSSSGKNSRATRRKFVEGLLGILVHYARSSDINIIKLVQENNLMTIFKQQISIRSHHRAKRRAAMGLKCLSESLRLSSVAQDVELQPPQGFCIPFIVICAKPRDVSDFCPLHIAACEKRSGFCLLKGDAIVPLVELLNEENSETQLAATEALLTVVFDTQRLKRAANELKRSGLFDSAINLFKEVRPGDLQEKLVLMVNRFFQVETIVQDYTTDQGLVRALIDALKYGSTATKRHAQDALTSLRQLSGVGRKNTNQSSGRSAR